MLMSYHLRIRKQSRTYTDARVSLLRELLGSMEIVKICAYEAYFEGRLNEARKKELKAIWNITLVKAVHQTVAFSTPTLAAVLSFVTYTARYQDKLDPAIMFPSLILFHMLRQPLTPLPRALSSVLDSKNALSRLKPVFLARTIGAQLHIDLNQAEALVVEKGEWVWYHQPKVKEEKSKREEQEEGNQDGIDSQGPTKTAAFRITDISLSIPRGSVVGIVGPVGSGKSSLLLGLLGEMPQTRGRVSFGGKTAFCSQMAWIQNATLRDNIVFGRPWDEERYWTSIRDASLEMDLELLPEGDLTEIGEKGKNLSGGQKQYVLLDSISGLALNELGRRVSIARALYDNSAGVFLLDDPLSAVDVHVSHALFRNAILGNLKARGKTVILVTHAIHLLPEVDHVYVIEKVCRAILEKSENTSEDTDLLWAQITLSSSRLSIPISPPSTSGIEFGRIVESGTYDQLLNSAGIFANFVVDFGSRGGRDVHGTMHKRAEVYNKPNPTSRRRLKAANSGKLEEKVMKAQMGMSRSTEWSVYTRYIALGLPWITIPVVLISILISRGCLAVNNYWLVWWQQNSFNQPLQIYMIGFAVLGFGYSAFALAINMSLGYLTYESARRLQSQAQSQVFRAPMSFFDTTPLARIISILGRDVGIIDNGLSGSIQMFIFTISSMITSVVTVTILQYYFVIIAIFTLISYQYFAAFYRPSARELKIIDTALQNVMYSHFSESLMGLATIRAYGKISHILEKNKHYVDLQNRALFLTC
ncbi:unnamed protein product, partial [Rhizoctonia solani]